MRHVRNLVCLLVVFAPSAACEAWGQGRVPHYQRSAAISPYVHLFRGNTGGVNSYFSFLRPIQEEARFRQYQQARNSALQQQVDQEFVSQHGVPNAQLGAQFRPATQKAGQVSRAGSFMNLSHYYRTGGGVR